VDQVVLIVDDDSVCAKLVSVLLTGEGYSTRTVGSAEDALLELGNAVPRLIVLDLILPMMSGLQLAQQLKADVRTRHVPIVAMTSVDGPAAERTSRNAGCDSYIGKPIDLVAFVELVRSHLKD
jgi:two-component system cell cycle response regulator DivK